MSASNETRNDIGAESGTFEAETQAGTADYKVLGYNTTSNGTTYGVMGKVDSSGGYGLYTPDDAKVDGSVSSTGSLRGVVDGYRVADLESDAAGSGNVVFGSPNGVKDGATNATIAGGGGVSTPNEVYANLGTIGGGVNNQVGTADGNTTIARGGAIAGGEANTVEGQYGAIGGGYNNTIKAASATIPGGRDNTVGGNYSMAAGRRAKADFPGNFVWADSTDSNFQSSGTDQFLVQAGGGVGIGTTDPSTQLEVNGDTTANGNLSVTGSESITNSSLSVFRSVTQEIASNNTRTTVKFDDVVDDDFSAWSFGDYTYTIPEDGDYHIDCLLNWQDMVSSAVTKLYVNVAGSDTIYVHSSGFHTLSASKTVTSLTQGDTVRVDVSQSDSSTHDLNSGDRNTFLTIHKVA